jgi:hypothetical protein
MNVLLWVRKAIIMNETWAESWPFESVRAKLGKAWKRALSGFQRPTMGN